MKASYNIVLVKPEPDKGSVSGLVVPDVARQKHFSIYGEVVSAGPFRFLGARLRRVMRRPVGGKAFWSRLLTQASCEHHPVIKPVVGDKVYFNHVAHFNKVGGLLIVPYDMLYAIDAPDGLIPVSGNIFVEMIEKRRFEEVSEGIFQEHYDLNQYGIGRVVSSGKPTKYAYGPRWDFRGNIPAGSIVTFRKNAAHRMEMDYHNSMTGQQSSLFVIKRKDVLTWTSAS